MNAQRSDLAKWGRASLVEPGWRLLKRLASVKTKEPRITVGLDIGSTALKVVVLGPHKSSGARPLLGQHLEPLGDNPESQIPETIRRACSALRLSVKPLNLSVSGQWVIMRVVEMPTLNAHELAQALPFEAQRYLPFNIQDVVLDGAILGPAERNKLWVLIVACKRELVDRRISWIKQAGFEPALIDVDALALANAFTEHANGQTLSGTHALINVGAQWTNLAVLNHHIPYLVRDIPWGAKTLIRHVAEKLEREEAQIASQLKQGTPPADLLEAMKAACESLTAELQLSFDFFESRFGPPPERLLVSGGMSQCPGFLEALKSHLAQTPVVWMPREGLSNQFAVAYGLALRSAST